MQQVVAHLVFLAEGTRRSVIGAGIRTGKSLHAGVDAIARRVAAAATPAELVTRLRAADGPLVEGPAQSLLLAATGRPGVPGVTGPGLAVLRP